MRFIYRSEHSHTLCTRVCLLLCLVGYLDTSLSSTAPSIARRPRFIPHPSQSSVSVAPAPAPVTFFRSIRALFVRIWNALAAPFLLAIRASTRVDGDPFMPTDLPHSQHQMPLLSLPWDDAALPTDPSSGDLVLPSWQFETLKDAVEGARPGARVYCRRGDHHWDGKITIKGSARPSAAAAGNHRALFVVGEGDSRLWGRWSMSRYAPAQRKPQPYMALKRGGFQFVHGCVCHTQQS